MLKRLQRRGLRALRFVPAPVREWLVRTTTPRYTLGTVCWIEHEGNVLLVETEYRRGWGFPGGLVDRNENPATGVVREVREETGLAVVLVGEPVVIVDNGQRLVDFFYRAVLAAGGALGDAHAASVEIRSVEWVPAGDAVARAEASAGGPWRKLQIFEGHPSGGLVFLDKADR